MTDSNIEAYDKLLTHLVTDHDWTYLDIGHLDLVKLRKLHEETSHASYGDLAGHRHFRPEQ